METDRPPVLRTVLRFLSFQASPEELRQLDNRHLLFGLLCTWLVGIGRSWDDPEAELIQHLGVGSVAYVFALSLLIGLTVKPLAAAPISYRQALTFVSLTSPPGLLYAIPVEMFLVPDVARNVNLLLLLSVAIWRVALLVYYLQKAVALRGAELLVATLLPLATIMAPLAVFQFMVGVASAMGGLREGQTVSDPATKVLEFLGAIAILAFLPLLAMHTSMAAHRK